MVAPMEREIDRLLDELENLRANRGALGPGHPLFKNWVLRARSQLEREGRGEALRAFDQLGFSRLGTEMWKREEASLPERRIFRAELEQARLLLRGADRSGTSGPAVQDGADGGTEQHTRAADWPTGRERDGCVPARGDPARETEEETMERKAEGAVQVSARQGLSPSARAQAIERLMTEFGSQMRNTSADWNRVQEIVAELTALKRSAELLDRLRSELAKPGLAWESARKAMTEVWAYRRDLLLEALPDLLEA